MKGGQDDRPIFIKKGVIYMPPGRPKTETSDTDVKPKPKPKAKSTPKKKSVEITDKLGEPTKCLKCGRTYPRQKSYFSPSYSPLYANNNGFLPICKDCMDGLLKEYIDTYDGDIAKAFRRVCECFDLYYSDELYSISKGSKGVAFLIGSYFSRLNNTQFLRPPERKIYKTFDDTLKEEQEAAEIAAEESRESAELASKGISENVITSIDEVKENKDLKVSQKQVKFWGSGFDPDEYKMLEDEYSSWVIRANNGETPSIKLESVLKSVCVTSIDIKRARAAGSKASEITSLQNMRMKLLEKAGFSPDQEDTDNIAEKNALGVLIDVWEKTEPVPKYPEENKIKSYIRIWFKGHLAKSANLKNDTEEEYKAEIDKYKIKILEDEPVYEIPPVTIEDGEENV